MGSLVDLNGFSDVVNNLINKISSAISWKITRDTPEKIAIDTYIEELKNSNLSPLHKAALIYDAKKTIKEYINQNDIVQKAIPMLYGEDHAQEIEDDWIASYMDKAKLISDEDVQLLWAKILAGEAEKPGSYSLRTLDTLKNISKKEVEIFQKAAKLSVRNGAKRFLYANNELLRKYDLSLDELIVLEECGLINVQVFGFTVSIDEGSQGNSLLLNNQNIIGIIKASDKTSDKAKQSVQIGVYVFSESGRELIQAINSGENDNPGEDDNSGENDNPGKDDNSKKVDSYIVEVLKKIKEDSLKNDKKVQITAHRIEKYGANGEISYDAFDLIADENV